MKSISRYLSRVLIVGSLVLPMISCSLLKGSGAEYEKSTVDIPLRLPKGLSEPDRDAALIVPE